MKNSGEEPAQQEQQALANPPCVTFEWDELVLGTNNFKEKTNLLGRGNFGRVFRFNLPRLNTVGAAKIQQMNFKDAPTEFDAEITTLQRSDHPNVIPLLGKSKFSNGNLCIVYEFMPNGSLDKHIFGISTSLDWNKRIRIALGVAKALVYLHNVLKVIHRDIKSSNVLLDADFVPKLSDFGLASSVVVDQNNVEIMIDVKPIKGTPGFIAPEIRFEEKASTKSDVYSYGVFLLELSTGREAYDTKRPDATRNITDWLKTVRYSEDDMHRLIDPKLGNRYSVEGLKRIFETANLCIKTDVNERPSMDVVEEMVRQASTYPVPDM